MSDSYIIRIYFEATSKNNGTLRVISFFLENVQIKTKQNKTLKVHNTTHRVSQSV